MVTKKEKISKNTFWWTGLLTLVTQTLVTEVRSIIFSTRNQIHTLVRIATVRFFLLLSSFLGIIFILIGFNRFLSEVFHVPGVAEVLLGSTILSLSLMFFFLLKNGGIDNQ